MKRENNRNKRGARKALVLAAMMMGCLGVMGISAYFTAADTATNTFTIGNISLELQEPGWDASNAENILPGQDIHKDPQIVNDGVNDEFVFLEVVIPYATLQTANGDGTWNAAADVELFSYDVNTTDWVQVGNAVKDEDAGTVTYVYGYAKNDAMTVLEKEDTTPALFEYVRFANVADASDLDASSLAMEINAYGIQTTNLNDGDTTIDGVNDDGKTAPADVWAVINAERPELQ